MKRFVGALTLIGAVAAATASFAQDTGAQTQSRRPYRGLFSSGADEAEQLLEVRGWLGGGADRGVLLSGYGGTGGGSESPREGSYGYGQGALQYTLTKTQVTLDAGGNVTIRRYSNETMRTGSGHLGGSLRGPLNTRFTASENVSYQPYLLLGLSPLLGDSVLDQSGMVREDFAVSAEQYVRYTTSAGVEQSNRLSRRATLGFHYLFSDFHNETSTRKYQYRSHAVGTTFKQGLTRDFGFHIGYEYRLTDTAQATRPGRLVAHNADIGVDFNRAFSLTRRTTFTMTTGSSAYVQDNGSQGQNSQTVYRLIGSARLNHEIGRTWNAFLAYDRNVSFLEAVNELLFNDGLSVGYGGLISRRLQFQSDARVAIGTVGLNARSDRFRMYTAEATLTGGITRHLALGATAFFNDYSFDTSRFLPSGVAPEMTRVGIRGYVTAWAPLWYRRRPNASR